MMGNAFSSVLKPLKRVLESGFEDSFGSGESPKHFTMIVSYCCDNLEARDRTAPRNGVGRRHYCARYRSPYECTMMGRGSSSRVTVDSVETQEKVNGLQKKADSPAWRGVVNGGGRY